MKAINDLLLWDLLIYVLLCGKIGSVLKYSIAIYLKTI
jgi:hypothetical protein